VANKAMTYTEVILIRILTFSFKSKRLVAMIVRGVEKLTVKSFLCNGMMMSNDEMGDAW
jgi:hypothetical protein